MYSSRKFTIALVVTASFLAVLFCWYFAPASLKVAAAGEEPGTPRATVLLDVVEGRPCPGYFTADISLLPGGRGGYWGMEMALGSKQSNLGDALNFGGALEANALGVSYAGFYLAGNAARERLIFLELSAQLIASLWHDSEQFGVEMSVVDADKRPVGSSWTSTLRGNEHFIKTSIALKPGFYTINVSSRLGSPGGTFRLSVAAERYTGTPGGFRGGLVMGGYLPPGMKVSGYSGFCIAETQSAEFQTIRLGGIGPLELKVSDGIGRTIYDSSEISFSREPRGDAHVRMSFIPNPVYSNTGKEYGYSMLLEELNGVGVKLSSLSTEGDTRNLLPEGIQRLEPWKTQQLYFRTSFPSGSLAKSMEIPFTLQGNDDQGHQGIMWRGAVRLMTPGSNPAANVMVDFLPNPLTPDDDGRWSFSLQLSETNGIGADLQEVQIGDWSGPIQQIFTSSRLPAKGSLMEDLQWPADMVAQEIPWIIKGKDDNGHEGLTWTGYQKLTPFISLLPGQSVRRAAEKFGFTPYQFLVYVPATTSRLTLEFESASNVPVLQMHVRAGQPVTYGADGFSLPVSDFQRVALGKAQLAIDAASIPALRRGTTYYIAVANPLFGVGIDYTLTAKLQMVSTTTTSLASTTTLRPTTSTTSKTTTTTIPKPTTTTTVVRATTTTMAATTTTLPVVSFTYGGQRSYPVSSLPGTRIIDEISGGTLVFPQGGSGNIAVKKISGGPDIVPEETAFEVLYSGIGTVQLQFVDGQPDRDFLAGFSGSDNYYIVGAPNSQAREAAKEWWFPVPKKESKPPTYVLPVDWMTKFKHQKLDQTWSASYNSYKSMVDLTLAGVADVVYSRSYFVDTISAKIYNLECFRRPEWFVQHQYIPFGRFLLEPLRTIMLSWNANKRAVVHEVGHYVHHILVGDAAYKIVANKPRPANHGQGTPGAWDNLIEEPSYITEFYMGTTDLRFASGCRDKAGVDPWQRNYPDLEGFAAYMVGSLIRDNENTRHFNSNREAKVPVLETGGDRTASLFKEVYTIIQRGLTDIYAFRTSIEAVLSTKYKQADKWPWMLQSIGWNYQVNVKFVDKNSRPVQDAAAWFVGKVGGKEYPLIELDSNTKEPIIQSTSGADGKFTIQECTGGDSERILRVALPPKSTKPITLDIPQRFSIPWNQSTVDPYDLKTITIPRLQITVRFKGTMKSTTDACCPPSLLDYSDSNSFAIEDWQGTSFRLEQKYGWSIQGKLSDDLQTLQSMWGSDNYLTLRFENMGNKSTDRNKLLFSARNTELSNYVKQAQHKYGYSQDEKGGCSGAPNSRWVECIQDQLDLTKEALFEVIFEIGKTK